MRLSRRFSQTIITTAALILSSCGGEDSGTSASNGLQECPPEVKRGGLSVGSRIDIDVAMKYTFWLSEYPPLSCAGALADLIPDLPNGFGLAPTTLTRPPIMGDDHVAFSLGEMPDNLMTEYDTANTPIGMKRIDYEIVRFTAEERATMDAWLANNTGSVVTKSFNGHEIHLAGSMATSRPGKNARVGTGILLPMKDNLLLRMSYTEMISDLKGRDTPMPSMEGNAALQLLAEIINKAEAAGKL